MILKILRHFSQIGVLVFVRIVNVDERFCDLDAKWEQPRNAGCDGESIQSTGRWTSLDRGVINTGNWYDLTDAAWFEIERPQ